MIRLSKEQVLHLHSQLIHATGGSCGVHDDNMLDSALATPFQSFGGDNYTPVLRQRRQGYAMDW